VEYGCEFGMKVTHPSDWWSLNGCLPSQCSVEGLILLRHHYLVFFECIAKSSLTYHM
jgi:hypothetical protein